MFITKKVTIPTHLLRLKFMKLNKNSKIVFRLFLIPAILVSVLLLIIKVPQWISRYTQLHDKETVAPNVSSFGIPIPKGYTVHGIDISYHQGTIDWQRVSQMCKDNIQIDFVFIKATEGITRQDEKFDTNWKQTAQNGILRGAYHFYYPSRDAAKQADNFIKKVKLVKGDLPPVIDIETSNGKSKKKIVAGVKIFLNKLEKKYKVKPIIYTNIHFYTTYLKGSFDKYPLWIAGYFDHDRFHSEFKTPWFFWQHSEKGKVDGIDGYVDFNVFKGDLEMLRKKCI